MRDYCGSCRIVGQVDRSCSFIPLLITNHQYSLESIYMQKKFKLLLQSPQLYQRMSLCSIDVIELQFR